MLTPAADRLSQIFSKVTSRKVLRRKVLRLNLPKQRLLLADLLRHPAASAKPAPRWKVERAWYCSRDDRKLFLPFAQRRQRAKQPVSVRMFRAIE
jgi:hypothetical protein